MLRELERVAVSAGQPPSLRSGTPSLTKRERRLFSVLLPRDAGAPPQSMSSPEAPRLRDETLVASDLVAARTMTEVARRVGGEFDVLADGSLLSGVTLSTRP